MRHLLAVLPTLCLATFTEAQSFTRDWRPEDRTVIGDFSRITAIAASSDRVYLVSPSAVLIWDPQFRRWQGSFDPPSPSLLARVFTGLADPLDNSLWLARPDGWVHYQPDIQLWDQGVVPDGVLAIAFDQDNPGAGLYIRTRRGDWQLLPRGGTGPVPAGSPARPIVAASVEQAVRSNPSLQANAAAILTDNRLRNVRYTAAARAFDNRGWYLGTSGIGALYVDDGAALPQRLNFGLPSDRVGAVSSWPGGVWAGTNRTPLADASLTFIAGDLSEFRSLPGPSAAGTPFDQVRELAGQGRALWAATDLGVARVNPVDGRVDLLDDRRGLPDSRVNSIASRGGRITVGTARGVARISDSLVVERLAPSYSDPAYAVFPAGDSVWVGTPSGVLLSLPGLGGLVRLEGLASPSFQTPVVDFATLGDTLVALTRDGLLWRDPKTRRWTLGPNLSALLGRLRRFVTDADGFWVAGDRALGFARLGTPPLRPLRDADLPGAINDLAVDGDHLWVATDRGLVRFRLSVIRP
jgi:ligand-binding sensor domain-containing protein